MWNLFKVNNKDTRTTSSGVFIVNFEMISHIALVFLLLILNKCRLGTQIIAEESFSALARLREAVASQSSRRNPALKFVQR